MKHGSALLIVLGMLSFMVVSAVGFAAYMRYSRLPSSFLRRSASSRQLVKAALAEAINEIDSMIGEDPYPDIRLNATKQKGPAKGSENRNTWAGNVYIGTHAAPGTGSGGYSYPSSESTVSTLTLEGLAYIPPSLVNEARYYSRHSAAGKWHDMAYDVGRYAFCAIDVSDCFDINALKADLARNSGENRVTLAHLFENVPDHTSTGSAAAWDTFIDNCYAQKMPLVSLADWNLAIANGDKSGGNVAGISAPFVKWIKSNGQGFLEVNDIEKVKLMPFVTDGWFPGADTGANAEGDLSVKAGQPYTSYSENMSLMGIIQDGGQTATWKKLAAESLCRLDLAALYDYLDDNEVPVSLAIPTVERVPMVCGMKQTVPLKVTVKREETEPVLNSSSKPPFYTSTATWKLDANDFTAGLQGGQLDVLFAYPFRRGNGKYPEKGSSFKAKACARIFFAPAGLKFRCADVALHPTDSDFETTEYKDGVFKVYCGEAQNLAKDEVLEDKDALSDVKTFRLNANLGSIATALNNEKLFTAEFKYEAISDGMGGYTKGKCEVTSASSGAIRPLDGNCAGPVDVAAQIGKDAFSPDSTDELGPEVVPYVSFWVRVLNSEGKTVDMVPASLTDDDTVHFGKKNVNLGPVGNQIGGNPTPLLRFAGTAAFKWGNKAESTAIGQVAWSDSAIACPDPRYNHAPEDWMTYTGSFDGPGWLNLADGILGNGRDRDIFMFVSGQEWMQSAYEIAHLPRLSNLELAGGSVQGNYATPARDNTAYPAAIGDCAHGNLMWRTYRCYSQDGGYDDFEGLGLHRSQGGYRITPYTQQTNVLAAAFANTPYDWWAASPYNEDIGLQGVGEPGNADAEGTMKASDFNKKYAFNDIGSDGARKIVWKDVEKFAGAFMRRLRLSQNRTRKWTDVYREMNWSGDDDHFVFDSQDTQETLESDTDYLSECDRKFLFGYWRECFANRQQLFLIFVRAEPALMGAGTAGAIPPALGGRAVALVWRNPVAGKIVADGEDPVEPSDEYAPHRTRILFYRQLD